MVSLVACLQNLIRGRAASPTPVAGLGLSLHGPVDAERGVLLLSEHLGWRDVPFREVLERTLGMPVFAEAETRAIALAEQCWGAARRVIVRFPRLEDPVEGSLSAHSQCGETLR